MHDRASGSVARCYRSRLGSGSLKGTYDTSPEFSRVISLNDLGKHEMQFDLLATAEECAALARRFELSAISGLRALGRLKRSNSGRVRLRATLEADVSQTCVVTLDLVVNRIEEDLDIIFEPEQADAAAPDITFDPTSDREPLTGDLLDVGEIVAEELALSLDSYPRKLGIAPRVEPGGPAAEAGKQPRGGLFEGLAALKRKE